MKISVTKSNLKYPLYSCQFINDHQLLVTGGGGEGNNGIDNKVTLLNIDDATNKIKKFRELKLSQNDDSPTCMDYIDLPTSMASSSFDLGADGIKVDGIFLLGCNENSNKITQTNINNSLQRFNYENQHMRFVASVDYDKEVEEQRDLNTYMKFLKLSENIEFAAVSTNKLPSTIRIINPITLTELYEIETGNELRDFDFQLGKTAKILSYVTKSTCELISCVTGSFITKSYQFDVNMHMPLKLKFITSETFFILLKNEVSNKFELHLFSMTSEIKLLQILTLKQLNFRGITSVDFKNGVLAVSGNDNSVSFYHLNESNGKIALKFLKKFDELHTFAITKITFNNSGTRLATVSADNSVSIIKLPKNFEKYKPTTKKLLSFITNCIILAVLAILSKFAFERDYHTIAQKQLIQFNNNILQPFLQEKAIPYVKEKMRKKGSEDVEYFRFKNSNTGIVDEFTEATILSRGTSSGPGFYYSTASETVYSTPTYAKSTYVDEDDDVVVNYQDYLAALSLNDIISVTTSGYESQITDARIQTVPNVEENVEEILNANYPSISASAEAKATHAKIQNVPKPKESKAKFKETISENKEAEQKTLAIENELPVTEEDAAEEHDIETETSKVEEAEENVVEEHDIETETSKVEETEENVVEEHDIETETSKVEENVVEEHDIETETSKVEETEENVVEEHDIETETSKVEETEENVVEEHDIETEPSSVEETEENVVEEHDIETEPSSVEETEEDAAEEHVIETEPPSVEEAEEDKFESENLIDVESHLENLAEIEESNIEIKEPVVEMPEYIKNISNGDQVAALEESDYETKNFEISDAEKVFEQPLVPKTVVKSNDVELSDVKEIEELVIEKPIDESYDIEEEFDEETDTNDRSLKSDGLVKEKASKPIEAILAEKIEARIPKNIELPIHTEDKVEDEEHFNSSKTTEFTEESVISPVEETAASYNKPTTANKNESFDHQLEEIFEENEQIEETITLDEL
ncbi:hypothetical protein QEN19_003705 [Hanseniaspora menglaensis]